MNLIWKPEQAVVVTPSEQLSWPAEPIGIGGVIVNLSCPRFMVALTTSVDDTQYFRNYTFGVN